MKSSILRRILKLILTVLIVLVILVAGLFGYLTITEFNPEEGTVDSLEIHAAAADRAEAVESPDTMPLRIVTWNIGFGALGDNADFFMDGGKSVITSDKTRVQSNMQMISEELKSLSPDIIFVQEVDKNSSRSYGIDETALLQETFPYMDTTFANNYKVAFVPYPIPPMGRMDSGILTMSSLPIAQAERIQLPCPFAWPVRIANLKRCLMIDRIPLEDGRELVLINLHLEAYDNGEGKVKQTQMLQQIMQQEAEKGNPVIAGGDWNQIFSSADHGQFPLQEGKWECGQIDVTQFAGDWQFLMDADLPSCRSLDQVYAGADKDTFQYYLLDGFILSSDIKVLSCKTQDLDFVCSDHNPVLLEIEL